MIAAGRIASTSRCGSPMILAICFYQSTINIRRMDRPACSEYWKTISSHYGETRREPQGERRKNPRAQATMELELAQVKSPTRTSAQATTEDQIVLGGR